MSENKKQPLVPRLRFPRFRDAGEWITVDLGKLSRLLTERVGSTTCTPYTIISGVGLISQVEKLGRTIAGNSLKNYLILQENDFAYNKSATKAYPQGFIALYAGDERAAVPNSIFTCFRVNQNHVIPTFLDALFTSNLHGKWLRTRIAVGARAHGSLQVSDDDLMATPVPLPNGISSLKEQQKIADCLSSLDDLISAEARKLDTLKTYKKGIMQQLFPREGTETVPRLRFPEFCDDQPWNFQTLGKLAKRSTQKNAGGYITRVLTNSAEYGVIDQRDFFDKDIANQGNLKGYYIVEEGDYVYNPRISTIAPVGPVSKNRIGLGVMSPLYTVFRFNNKRNDFYAHYVKSTHWHHYMRQASSTGARHDRMSITNSDFMGLPLPVPKPEEQQKIADCLSSLDDLISAEARKLDTLKDHKKGLMQQLFPVLDEVSA